MVDMAKISKTNVMRVLDKNKISYEIHTYEASDGKIDGMSVAAKVGRPPEDLFKTLVTKGESGDYFVFVVCVADELDLKKSAASVGEKAVHMIPVADINRVTGYIRGGCSPIGMKKPFQTVIDKKAQGNIVVSAGKIGMQVEVSAKELADLIGATFSDIHMS
jgi:ybaK/ebsC protein